MLIRNKYSGKLRDFATLISDMRLSHYILVGGISALTDIILIFTCFHVFHIPLFVATIVGFVGGLLVNFVLNKLWSFQSKATGFKKTQREVLLYGLLVGFNLVFTYIIVAYLISLGLGIVLAKVLTILATTTWNFILYKKVIFQ